MQSNRYPNRFQTSGVPQQSALKARQSAPLQSQASLNNSQSQPQQPVYYTQVLFGQPMPTNVAQPVAEKAAAPQGLFGKLKQSIWHLVSEESKQDRPIGISQLTRKTFNVRPEVASASVFKNSQLAQDFRFANLTQKSR